MDPLCGRAGSTGDAPIETRIAGDSSADAASSPLCELSEARRSEGLSGDGGDVGRSFRLECDRRLGDCASCNMYDTSDVIWES